MKKQVTAYCVVGMLAFAAPIATVSADTAALIKSCDSCHGVDGNSEDGEVPNIAGMSVTYLHDMMMAYKSGERPGIKYKPKKGDESDMNAESKDLSEDEINALAKHYAAKKFAVHAQAVDAALAAKGAEVFDSACEKCHSERGSLASDDSGILLGQWKPYMEKQFKLLDSGKREMTKKMKKKYDALDAADKAAIIEFLAAGK